jgi:hypothetical protein
MYIKVINEIPISYSIEQLRYENPNISFPINISNEILARFDVYPCSLQEIPSINDKTQKIEEGDIIKENGNWIKSWNIIDKTQEEIDIWTETKSLDAKAKRNILLSETDHFALSDNTLTPEMAEYRQALRDITQQDGFPENIEWPVKPV